jgi:hypothetical protein
MERPHSPSGGIDTLPVSSRKKVAPGPIHFIDASKGLLLVSLRRIGTSGIVMVMVPLLLLVLEPASVLLLCAHDVDVNPNMSRISVRNAKDFFMFVPAFEDTVMSPLGGHSVRPFRRKRRSSK